MADVDFVSDVLGDVRFTDSNWIWNSLVFANMKKFKVCPSGLGYAWREYAYGTCLLIGPLHGGEEHLGHAFSISAKCPFSEPILKGEMEFDELYLNGLRRFVWFDTNAYFIFVDSRKRPIPFFFRDLSDAEAFAGSERFRSFCIPRD